MADKPTVATLESQLAAANNELEFVRKTVAKAQAENQVWRSLLAEFREAIAEHLQWLPSSKRFERIRQCMADPKAMEDAIALELIQKAKRDVVP